MLFNVLPFILAFTSMSTLVFGYFFIPHIQYILSFLRGFLTGFLAYLLYAKPKETTDTGHSIIWNSA